MRILFYLFIAFIIQGCNTKHERATPIGKVEFCGGGIDVCNYSNDIALFDSRLYIVGKDPHSFSVYDLSDKKINKINIHQLPQQASHIRVTKNHLYIASLNAVYMYTHDGHYVKKALFPFEGVLNNFFVSKEQHLIGLWRDKIFIVDSTGQLIKEQSGFPDHDLSYYMDENVIYGGSSKKFFKIDLKDDRLAIQNFPNKITADMEGRYFATMSRGASIWYDYFKRDTLFLYNDSLTKVVHKIALGNSFQPEQSELEFESGSPLFQVLPVRNELILIRSYKTSVDVYRVKL